MRKFLKIVVPLLIAAFVVIQFFQPEKNSGEITSDHIFEAEQVPDNVKTLLKNACMDCHSNQTQYLWYHKLAPVSWMIDKHIREGKKELNFSEWGKQDDYDKFGAFEDMVKELENKTMPIKAYKIMHKPARLSDDETNAIIAWCNKRSEEITRKFNQ